MHVKNHFPDRTINVYPDDLFDLSFKSDSDKAQRRCSTIVKDSLDRLNQNTGSTPSGPIKFLVPLLRSKYEAAFLRNLFYQMCLRIGLCSNTLLHYYFLMSDRQFHYLNAKPCSSFRHYRSSTVIYNTIFKVHNLESFDLKESFGIKLNKIQKTADNNQMSYQRVNLVWLEPRLSVVDQLNSRRLVEFRFLVNQLMHRRTSLVLPVVEKWFDSCAQDVARFGINASSRSGDLDRGQYVHLFTYLRNRPDYKNSTFLQAAALSDENIQSSD